MALFPCSSSPGTDVKAAFEVFEICYYMNTMGSAMSKEISALLASSSRGTLAAGKLTK